jgi:phosphate transport system substrate-binding protein
MKKLMKYIFIPVYILAAAVVYTGCNYDQMKSRTTIGELSVGVDESVYPVVKREADEFMRLNQDAKINIQVKTSKEVIADLANGNLKTILTCRDLTDEEKNVFTANKTDFKKNKFALDGIGVIVNTANKLTKLNYNELKKIFTGQAQDWSGMDGDNKDIYKGKIKVFIARKNAAIHDIFLQKVLNSTEFAKTDLVCSTSVQMLNEIKKDENAIGFIAMSWVTRSYDTLDMSVKPLKIASVDSAGRIGDYVSLHQAYIADKTYPLVTEDYILSTDYSMNLSVGFMSFVLAYDGQKIVLSSGLVPVTQPVRIIQLN